MIALFAASSLAHVPVIHIVEPDDPDWCGRIAAALGGDLIMFQPGTYAGGCHVTGLPDPDYPGALTTIQSFDPNDRPVFVHDGESEFGFRIEGVDVSFLQVTFDGFPEGVPAIEYAGGSAMRIRYSTFQNLELAVVATGSVTSLFVEHSDFFDVGMAVDMACEGCDHPGLYLNDNLVRGGGFAIGGTGAQLVDNVVEGAAVAFSVSGEGHSLIGNAAWGGETAAVIDGGASLVNNILTGQSAVEVVGGAPSFRLNTLVGDLAGDLSGAEWAGNAIGGDPELPPGATDNVTCPDQALCFANPSGNDWFPPAGSPLRGAVAAPTVGVDWCSSLRVAPGSAGAFEGEGNSSMGGLVLARKSEVGCDSDGSTTPEDTATDTGSEPKTTLRDPNDTDESGEKDDEGGGCGCRTGASGNLGWWLAALLVVGRAREPVAQ